MSAEYKWLVCIEKRTRKLFSCSRQSRETLMDYWTRNKIIVPSIVWREFLEQKDAEDYLIEMKDVDNLINGAL